MRYFILYLFTILYFLKAGGFPPPINFPPYLTSSTSFQEIQMIDTQSFIIDSSDNTMITFSGDTLEVYTRDDINDDYTFVKDLAQSDDVVDIAIDHETIAVAIGDDLFSSPHRGIVIYVKPENGWQNISSRTAYLVLPSDAHIDSIEISDDTIVVSDSYQEAVYIFVRPEGGWQDKDKEDAKLVLPIKDIAFGTDVAIEDDVIVVGAPSTTSGKGAAFVFVRPSTGWNGTYSGADQLLQISNSFQFGYSVAIDSNVIVASSSHPAAAYVYKKSTTGNYIQDATLMLNDADRNYWYHDIRVEKENDIILLSVSNANPGLYVFNKNENIWKNTVKLPGLRKHYVLHGDTSLSISKGTIHSLDSLGKPHIYTSGLFHNAIENKTDVMQITAKDTEGTPISYRLLDGKDAALFTLDPQTGLLRFKKNPDYEAPQDSDANNIYRFLFQISDGKNNVTYHASIRVGDIKDEIKLPKSFRFSSLHKIIADDADVENDFGHSIAMSSGVAVVGAPEFNGERGAAYIYEYNSNSKQFEQKAKLISSDYKVLDSFGSSVAIDGNTVVIGAPGVDNNTILDIGAVYVYEKPAVGWDGFITNETKKLTASDSEAEDEFGTSVAIDGNTVVVGRKNDFGSVYVFEKKDDWKQTAKLLASDTEREDAFGESVAINGNTIIVGAPGDDNDTKTDAGSIYVFEKTIGTWIGGRLRTKLVASDAKEYARFGNSVALYGDTVAVGAKGDEINNQQSVGSAYIFEKPIEGWHSTVERAKLTPYNKKRSMYFGHNVAISREKVLVGAPGSTDDDDAGSAFIFQKPEYGWKSMNETSRLTASDAEKGDRFGYSVAIEGDMSMIGAPLDNHSGVESAGSAYSFKAKGTINPGIIMYLLD